MKEGLSKYTFLLGVVLVMLVTSSCWRDNGKKEDSVARVNESYLPISEIETLVPLGTMSEDSISIVKNYLDNWATKQLLLLNFYEITKPPECSLKLLGVLLPQSLSHLVFNVRWLLC